MKTIRHEGRRTSGWRTALLGWALALLAVQAPATAAERLALAGEWRCALGVAEPAFPQGALPSLNFEDTLTLPGTTETNGKGPLNPGKESGGLTRVRTFAGAAWYQRDVEIPATWAGRRIELRLERTKYTQVWLDDQPLGEQGHYTTAQVYDLTTRATPGAHRLTVMVDNRRERRPVLGQAHQFDDSAQTNWNGVLGEIALVATPTTWIDDVQVYSDVAAKTFRVRTALRSLAPAPAKARLHLAAASFNEAENVAPHRPAMLTLDVEANPATPALEFNLPLGDDARQWDEFSPALYRVTVTLETDAGRDERTVETGLREFRTRGTQFTINGRATYLRGKHEAGIFPLEGHPPMDVAGWDRYLRVVRDWGFNHVRCHTWVPPEAAFAAADRLGMYLQPELPFWGTFDAKVRDWLLPEGDAVLRAYGNHPSFVMMTLANEAGGDRAVMNALVSHLRASDPRHLYADGSNNVLWEPVFQPSNDFMISAKVRPPADPSKQLVARGSFCVFDGNEGHTQWGGGDTRYDFGAALAGLPVPFVGHETGQWTVYPNFQEIPRYTGVTRAHNLERFRATLVRRGMGDQADAFQRASGALAAELYREENELFLRTPGAAGFQHLDLQDYSGQGSALVGLLDAFMTSKGLVTPEEFRQSNSPMVLLARFDRYAWTTAESYVADLQLAHYGAADLRGAVTAWTIVDAAGKPVLSGALPALDVAQGGLRNLGRLTVALAALPAPARYDLRVTLTSDAQSVTQAWPLWVYPPRIDTSVPAGVTLVRAYDAAARRALAAGGRVVLIPGQANWANTLPGGYATDYWNWPMFNGTPGTMGLLIDPTHPALAHFPTKFHSERQWTEIAHASSPVLLFATPAAYRPVVQVVDNYERNEKLGLIFETQVGSGKLLVCAADLLGDKLREVPAAQQLLASLLAYAGSGQFAPPAKLDAAALDLALRPSLARGQTATTSSCFTPPWGFVPKPLHAFDGDLNTKWFPAEGDQAPWIAVDLGAPRAIDTVEIVWEFDEAGYAGTLETSADGQAWTPLAGTPLPAATDGRTLLHVAVDGVRHVRLHVNAWPGSRRAAVRELRVLGPDARP